MNFCRERNFFFPRLPGFGADFFLLFLQGRKKLLPLGTCSGFSFSYYNKDKAFTKSYLWNIIQQHAELLDYFPDRINPEYLDRNYMLSVLAIKAQPVWLSLYNEYKRRIALQPNTKWDQYGIEMSDEMYNAMNAFITSSNGTASKGFRTTKKGVPNPALRALNQMNAAQGQGVNPQQDENMNPNNQNMNI